MKRLAVIAVVALGLASSASGKAPPNGFRVCGEASCVAIAGTDAEILAINMFYGAGTELAAGPSPAPFYALHWTSAQTGAEETGYYVSSANAVSSRVRAPTTSPGWITLSTDAQTRLASITAALEPFPAATPSAAVVGGRPVRDPAGYALLWQVGWHAHAWTSRWLTVRVVTDKPSPWQGSLLVARRRSLLMRDGSIYAIPASLAERIRARASLAT